jgi:hypothetical protein
MNACDRCHAAPIILIAAKIIAATGDHGDGSGRACT